MSSGPARDLDESALAEAGIDTAVIASVGARPIASFEAAIERVAGAEVPIPMLAREGGCLPNLPWTEGGIESVVEF